MLKPAPSMNRMGVDSVDTELEECTADIELQHLIPVHHDDVIKTFPTKREARTAHAQFFALFWSLFLMGWSDGSTGPLLPRIQKSYDIGFQRVSWIFVLGCVGVVVGALLNMPLIDRFGLGKILVFGSLLQLSAYFIQFLQPSFPLFVLSFGLNGLGQSFQDASANGFIATLQNDAEYKMGFMHAGFSAGALVSPLAATYFAQSTHWSYHYLFSISLGVSNVIILASVFRFQAQDECLRQAGEEICEKTEEIHEDKFIQLMRSKTVHILVLFIVVYIGVDLTIRGWIVTFMLIVRGGGPLSGYVITGFSGGITFGRFMLVGVTKKIGIVNAIYIYTAFVIFFQLLVWFLPSFNGSAICVCIVGILLGPILPIALQHIPSVIPHHLVNGMMGWSSACGAAGSALISLLMGTMASKWGIVSLQPLLLVMMVIMVTVWYFVPKKP